jgi:hypothetical protein
MIFLLHSLQSSVHRVLAVNVKAGTNAREKIWKIKDGLARERKKPKTDKQLKSRRIAEFFLAIYTQNDC